MSRQAMMNLRVPTSLKELLAIRAKAAGRSMADEIIVLLHSGLKTTEDLAALPADKVWDGLLNGTLATVARKPTADEVAEFRAARDAGKRHAVSSEEALAMLDKTLPSLKPQKAQFREVRAAGRVFAIKAAKTRKHLAKKK